MTRQTLWFLRSQNGETVGPFPGPMLIRHRLLGRVKPTDQASVDGVNWQSVQDFPELNPAPVSAAAPVAADDPFWNEERAKAKLRWAEERQAGDRRSETTPAQAHIEARSGKDRRAAPVGPPTPRSRSKLHGEGGRNWAAVALVVLGCAALVLGLIWLGTVIEPVKPLNVKIGQ